MATYRFLQPGDIKRLQSYEFAAKAMVEGYLAGHHRSRQRGSSIEFHEYRQYVPGDDPAQVDWRVYGRTDRHYLRTYEQETRLECHVFLDSSASMGYRGPDNALTKLEYASFFAACLAWLVTKHQDQVSLHLFDREIRQHFPPGSTRQHLHQILNTLERNQPGNETDLAAALQRAQPLIRRKGTLVVLSDFYEAPESLFHALNPYLHRGFRVHLFHLLDPTEVTLPGDRLLRFVDLESPRTRVTAHTKAISQAYNQALQGHIRRLRRLASRRQVDYFLSQTNRSYFDLFDRLVA